jgi:propionyl-CoA carboxylase alpha chain
MPSTGKLTKYLPPHGEGIRVDDGYREGLEIPIHYDPLLAKLIVHAKTRNEAIRKMLNAIDGYSISGVETTLPFGKFAFNHPSFITGKFDTRFVELHIGEFIEEQHNTNYALARFISWLYQKRKSKLVLPEMEE